MQNILLSFQSVRCVFSKAFNLFALALLLVLLPACSDMPGLRSEKAKTNAQLSPRLENYRQQFAPVKTAGKDYWEFLKDGDIQGCKEAGNKFYFDPDKDPLCKEAGIEAGNMAAYTHVPSYQKYLEQNPDKALIINACAGDLWLGHCRVKYFTNSPICSIAQVEKPDDFFESGPWKKIATMLGNRLLGFLYVEGSWQVRGVPNKKSEDAAKRYGLAYPPKSVEEYYDFYSRLFKKIQEGTSAKEKLLVVPQFETGYFLPLALGAPAASYYVYGTHNVSLKMAYARGAARQYGKPILVYFAHFPVADWVDHPIEIDIPYYIGISPYAGAGTNKEENLEKLQNVVCKRVIPAAPARKLIIGGSMSFNVPREDFVAVTMSATEVDFRGPLCSMAFSAHRRHMYFQYLGGIGMMIREEGSAWGTYDPEPWIRKKSFCFVKENEPLSVYGYTNFAQMPEKLRRYTLMRIEQKNIYQTTHTLHRKEILEFAKKQGRGTAFAPVAYVVAPRLALFNNYSFLGGKEEDFTDLQRMVFNWHRQAFIGAPGNAKPRKSCADWKKASEIDVAVRNFQHRREITDVLTTDASSQVLQTYPIVVTIGPEIGGIRDKMLAFLEKGGTWVANIDQLTAEEWKEFLPIALTGPIAEGSAWTNVITGKEFDESQGKYQYVRLQDNSGEALAKKGKTLIRDKSGDPLAIEYSAKGGRIVLMLQKSCLLRGENYGSHWSNKPGISTALFDVVEMLADGQLPVKVEGNIQSLYNLMPDGWMVTLMNDDGVSQYIGKPEVHDPDCVHEVVLRFPAKPQNLRGVLPKQKLEAAPAGNEWILRLKVEPGEIQILRFDAG